MIKTKKKKIKKTSLTIGKVKVLPGERKKIFLDVASLYDYTQLTIPIEVIRGKEDGPVLFISAAIHGDEINGVEIIKKILKMPLLNNLKGTLIAIPVVNIFGFNHKSRYLPDRKDLNRCFPGNLKGSLGSRIAKIFMTEIVNKCTHGIDLHTGAIHRTNLPQVRACLDDPETNELARCFGAPVVINSSLRDGSLREAARKKDVVTLLFEGGEALRFEEDVIRAGVNGCLSVMSKIGMIAKKSKSTKKKNEIYIAKKSYWVRAPHSGSFRSLVNVGSYVSKGDVLAEISDPFGENIFEVKSFSDGIVIGMSMIPLVNKGDAMVHVATFSDTTKIKSAFDEGADFSDIVY